MLRSSRQLRDGVVRRIMICFGGADPHNHTGAALQALRGLAGGIDRVDVVAGPSNPHRERIAALCAGIPGAILHFPAADIADLLAGADLAIGAGGAMSWERACLGVPTIAFGIARNQRKVLEALIEAGCVLGMPEMQAPDVEKMAAWISSALANPPLLRGLARRSAALTDGLGAERVASALFPASLVFRRATMDDAELIFRCRNHPAVRGASLDSREFTREAHAAWMGRTLASRERVLLVAEHDGEPQGVVRFDLSPPEARISVYRVPSGGTVRLGLIRQATAWLHGSYPSVRRIVAEVLPGNTASLAAFHAAGYRDGKYVLDTDLDTP
jgi:RimJ/RimL family protein N-acetyltransferase